MLNNFHFKGFEPNESIRIKADLALDRLMDKAPFGSYVNALLEKEGEQYRCSIHLFTQHGPFFASMVDADVLKTLDRVEATLIKKIIDWKSTKYQHQQMIA